MPLLYDVQAIDTGSSEFFFLFKYCYFVGAAYPIFFGCYVLCTFTFRMAEVRVAASPSMLHNAAVGPMKTCHCLNISCQYLPGVTDYSCCLPDVASPCFVAPLLQGDPCSLQQPDQSSPGGCWQPPSCCCGTMPFSIGFGAMGRSTTNCATRAP